MCDHLHSRANLSSIARLASCFGLRELHVAGATKLAPEIARDAASTLGVVRHRTLPPLLERLRAEGHTLVGLEQTTGSVSLFRHAFVARTALVVGNERRGL